jgi:peptidoglycan/LPS O-acetylase OafA/YrhL
MNESHPATPALLAGAVAGALILGLAGRLAMAAVALATGHPTNLSLRGLVMVTLVGAVVGALGGVLVLVLRRTYRGSGPARGLAAGAVMFLGSMLVAVVTGKLPGVSPIQILTLAVVAATFLVYGVSADALLSRFEQRGGTRASHRTV